MVSILKSNNGKISPIEYYRLIKINTSNIISFAKNVVNPDDMIYINRIARDKQEIILFEEDALNEVITINANIIEDDIVEGSGKVVDKKTKLLALNYIKNNHLPLRTDLYYECINKIINNQLDLDEKIDSLYEQYVEKLKKTESYSSKVKKKV